MPSSAPSTSTGGLRSSSVLRPLRPLIILAAIMLVTAALASGRELLIPIALAMLLAFVLSPPTAALQRRGLGRVASAMVIVVLAFSLLGAAGWVLTQQVTSFAGQAPRYSAVIKEKVARWRRDGGGRFLGKVRSSVDDVVEEIQKSEAPRRGTRPTPVVIEGADRSLLGAAAGVLKPLAMAGLVAVLVVFMLLERAELRNRLIRLVGYGHLTLTTKAMDEAAERISRYLVNQSLVNALLGLAFGVALYLIGVPYALLWGAGLAVLRFIPYVGVWIGLAPPLLFSLALFDGWMKPLFVLGTFLVLELTVGGFLEPIIYSQQAGVSKVALLIAVAFWTWLWGPVGLVLATPVTVCLLVLAKYVPEMDFVAILAGAEPALEPPVSFYQRLVAEDLAEASLLVDEFIRTHTPDQVYDGLLVPALVAAKRDRSLDRLSEEGEAFIVRAMRDILEDLPALPAPGDDDTEPAEARARVLACPARDAEDELALVMLRQLLAPTRCAVDVVSATVLSSEIVASVETAQPHAVCVAALPPEGLAQARYLCKRLRGRSRDLAIVVGRWGADAGEEDWSALLAAGASHASASLLETRDHVVRLVALVAKDAAVTAA